MTTPAPEPVTRGIHHLGLNVGRLEASAAFFTDVLGWRELRRDPDYPAIFVSDGVVTVTLWGAGEGARSFDFRRNVGLHHVAFGVTSREALEAVYARIRDAADACIEFAPQQLRDGPAMHMMCFDPSGIRIEFIWPG